MISEHGQGSVYVLTVLWRCDSFCSSFALSSWFSLGTMVDPNLNPRYTHCPLTLEETSWNRLHGVYKSV